MTRPTRPQAPTRLVAFGLIGIALLCSAIGCSTHAQRVRTAREDFYAGQLAPAHLALEQHIASHPDDADATSLDLAMVQLLNGQPEEAERTLRRVRDALDHFEQKDIAETSVSMLTDDQHLAYSGTNYEKVLTRVFLALANLLHDGQDAESYSLQINAKQQELMQRATAEQVANAESTYTPLAIGPYLRGLLRESTFANYDDAARAYDRVVSWQPEFQAAHADLARAQRGVHSQGGCGVLYVFALLNRGPVKEQVAEIPTSAALLIADRIVSAVGEYDVPPTLAPIKIPKVMLPPRTVDCLALSADGEEVGRTETICDIGDLVLRQEAIELPHIMARAVARRVLKKSAIYAAKDYVEADNPLSDFGLSALGVLWEATEAADTRCWGLLPREIQVVRIELPAGQHTLELAPVLTNGIMARGPRTTIHVEDGRNTYLLACFPGPKPVGQLLQR
jgi:tetratricopeptide (TPR) repeat protein